MAPAAGSPIGDEAGLQVSVKHVVGTQWREHLEERNHSVSRDLLKLARLRRTADRIIEQYGHSAYQTAEASLQWGVHQFLGRFLPVIYVLKPRALAPGSPLAD